tara:strand:- start:268 stop:963 length:696 start_codon:yes stop_codon:yes gene_type:complete
VKKKNKVNLKRVVKARGGQDMGAGSSGMGSGNTGSGNTSGQTDTGDLGTEAANVAANVSATSHTGNNTGGKTDSGGKVTVNKGPVQVPGPFAYTISGALFNKISKGLYDKKNLKEQKKVDALGGEMLTQGKPPGPVSGGGGGQDAPTTVKPVAPVAAAPKRAVKPVMPYYMGFDFQKAKPFKRGGLSGGKRFGPPPKKGPNPHGKCPFRKDGIRGVGAVQKGRGVKFVGVK